MIRGVIAEAPAGTGYTLGELTIPALIVFGKLDTWAGKSDTDFIWIRTYPSSPISIDEWVTSLKANQRPIEYRFYENARHSFHEGPLQEVTVKRGASSSFTAYQGADAEALKKYQKDLVNFIRVHSVNGARDSN